MDKDQQSLLITVLQIANTVFIGWAGIYFSRKQYLLSELNIRQAMHERRLKAYQATREFLWKSWNGTARYEDVEKFNAVFGEARFWFDLPFEKYLKEIRDRGNVLAQQQEETIGKNQAQDDNGRSELSEKISKEKDWFKVQLEMVAEKFRHYMTLA